LQGQLESLRSTEGQILAVVRDEHADELERLAKVESSLRAELAGLRGPRWTMIRRASQEVGGQEMLISRVYYLLGSETLERPAILLSCGCVIEQAAARIEGVYSGMVANPSADRIDDHRVRFVFEQTISNRLVLVFDIASKQPIANVDIEVGALR
jgi:hypothetical protein